MANEQNEPVLDGAGDAGVEEKIAGLMQQIKVDAPSHSPESLVELVTQRFADAGIPLDEASLQELISEVTERPATGSPADAAS